MSETFLHDLPLGERIPRESLQVLLQNQRDSEMLRGLLQLLREQAAVLERTGRQPPQGVNDPLEFRAYHAGAADALEEQVLTIWRWANPLAAAEQAAEEADA